MTIVRTSVILLLIKFHVSAAQPENSYDPIVATIQQAASEPSKVDAQEWQRFVRDTAAKLSLDMKLFSELKSRFLTETNVTLRLRFGQVFYAYFLTRSNNPPDFTPIDTDILISMYSDPDPDLNGLARLPIRGTSPEIYNLFQVKYFFDKDSTARKLALSHFRKRAGNLGLPYYLMLIEDEDKAVREEAIKAITNCEKKIYLVPLLRKIMALDPRTDHSLLVLEDIYSGLVSTNEQALGKLKKNPDELRGAIIAHFESER